MIRMIHVMDCSDPTVGIRIDFRRWSPGWGILWSLLIKFLVSCLLPLKSSLMRDHNALSIRSCC